MNVNMKKIMKILAIVLVVMMMFTVVQPVFAKNETKGEIKPDSLTASYGDSDGGLSGKAGQLIGLIRNVAVVVGVIMLMVIGVKFMLGSAEEKAEYKKSLMPLVIGIVIVMAATTLVSFVYNFVSEDPKEGNKNHGSIIYYV